MLIQCLAQQDWGFWVLPQHKLILMQSLYLGSTKTTRIKLNYTHFKELPHHKLPYSQLFYFNLFNTHISMNPVELVPLNRDKSKIYLQRQKSYICWDWSQIWNDLQFIVVQLPNNITKGRVSFNVNQKYVHGLANLLNCVTSKLKNNSSFT